MVSSRFNVVCASNGFAHKKQISFKMDIKRYSYSRYWTGTSLQLRLMRGNNIKKRLMSIAFEKTARSQGKRRAFFSPIFPPKDLERKDSIRSIRRAVRDYLIELNPLNFF